MSGLLCGVVLAWATTPLAAAERVIAIGDVHGAFGPFSEVLAAAGVVDEGGRWAGGDTVLVQTGDLTDRGVEVRKVLDLTIALQNEAPESGGRVVALLGNHEINNLVGYRADVAFEGRPPAAVYATFAGADSDRRRKAELKSWNRWRRRFPACADPDRDAWLARHPPGYVEYAEAFSPTGEYGGWLRTLPVVAKVDDTVFLHGGLSPELPAKHEVDDLDAINAAVAAEIADWDRDRATLENAGLILPSSELGEVFCAVEHQLASLAARAEQGNRAAASEHAKLLEIRQRLPSASSWLSFAGDGPLWFRGYARWDDVGGRSELDRVAELFGARRFVVGHTPQIRGIVSRFDRRLFLIDTAMTFGTAAGGRPAALEIAGDDVFAVYREERVALIDDTPTESSVPQSMPVDDMDPAAASGNAAGESAGEDRLPEVQTEGETTGDGGVDGGSRSWRGADGRQLPFSRPEEVQQFLATARVLSVEDIPVGVTKPKRLLLEKDGTQSRAVFRHLEVEKDRQRLSTGRVVMFFKDSFVNEVAAYELGRVLGIENIPPAVLREVRNERGSVQIWVEDAMTEQRRREDEVKPPSQLHFNRQFYEMRVFDNLIHNIDRNQGNILFDDQWQLWMIDHTRAFARDKTLNAPRDVIKLSRSLWHHLQTVDDATIEAAVAPYLGKPEVRALLVRRERLVETIEALIASYGEEVVLFNYGDPPPAKVRYAAIEVPPPPAE